METQKAGSKIRKAVLRKREVEFLTQRVKEIESEVELFAMAQNGKKNRSSRVCTLIRSGKCCAAQSLLREVELQ